MELLIIFCCLLASRTSCCSQKVNSSTSVDKLTDLVLDNITSRLLDFRHKWRVSVSYRFSERFLHQFHQFDASCIKYGLQAETYCLKWISKRYFALNHMLVCRPYVASMSKVPKIVWRRIMYRCDINMQATYYKRIRRSHTLQQSEYCLHRQMRHHSSTLHAVQSTGTGLTGLNQTTINVGTKIVSFHFIF